MTREEARADINSRSLEEFISLQASKKAGRGMYVCPVCGSGTGSHRTGALHIYPDTHRVVCFAGGCFTPAGEDTLGALRIIWQCGETEALERAGYSLDKEALTYKEHKENIKHQEHNEQPDNSLFYRQCHEALKNAPAALGYLHGRGISDGSIEKFNLGYCESWKHSKAGERVKPSRRIIIPRTPRTYTARRIDEPENDFAAQYVKQVAGAQRDLFNLGALDGADVCYICEGELDAISLHQAGAPAAVGIGSISNCGKMLEEAKKWPAAVFVPLLDADKDKEDGSNPGQDAQRRLVADMQAAGLAVLNADPAKVYGGAKDANEAFVADPARLEKIVAQITAKALELKDQADESREEDLAKRTGAGMIDNFLLSVKARTYEPIPTGFSDLDKALEGGFLRGCLVTLGAGPGMGKTAICQAIFENLAAAGHDCIFCNLEMSTEQLLARSISRIVWQSDGLDVSALEVLRGYQWTDEQADAIRRAAEKYRAEIAPHIALNPAGGTNDKTELLSAIENETRRIKAQGKPAPLICADYLQLISTGERDAIEGLKRVTFELKDFAKRENTVVFVIIATNRESNKSGLIELESGRDSSVLEYSGDIMMGLSYKAIADGTSDIETIRRTRNEAHEKGAPLPAICTEVSLRVLKNRFGAAGRRANFIFDGKHSTFRQLEEAWTPCRKNPFLNQ